MFFFDFRGQWSYFPLSLSLKLNRMLPRYAVCLDLLQVEELRFKRSNQSFPTISCYNPLFTFAISRRTSAGSTGAAAVVVALP